MNTAPPLKTPQKKKKGFLTARNFNIILWVALVSALAISVAAFTFGRQELSVFSDDVAKRRADAKASQESLTNLQLLETKLASLKDISTTLDSTRASSDFPQFEAEANVRAIAQYTGIPITHIGFIASDAATTTTKSTTGSTTTPTAKKSTTQKTAGITVEIAEPIPYTTLLSFLTAIETSAPKLQVTGITLPQDATRASVELSQITITMAVK